VYYCLNKTIGGIKSVFGWPYCGVYAWMWNSLLGYIFQWESECEWESK
jgi:hypothetical protein